MEYPPISGEHSSEDSGEGLAHAGGGAVPESFMSGPGAVPDCVPLVPHTSSALEHTPEPYPTLDTDEMFVAMIAKEFSGSEPEDILPITAKAVPRAVFWVWNGIMAYGVITRRDTT